MSCRVTEVPSNCSGFVADNPASWRATVARFAETALCSPQLCILLKCQFQVNATVAVLNRMF
jgi:hypothetical protein